MEVMEVFEPRLCALGRSRYNLFRMNDFHFMRFELSRYGAQLSLYA